MIGKSTIEAIH